MKELACNLQKYYNFNDEELELTFSHFKPEKLAAKSFFLEEGKVADKVAFIVKGLLRSFFYDDQGEEVTTHFFKQGGVALSIYSFNRQLPARESIVAVEDSELIAASYEGMQELIQKIPTWQQIVKDTDEYKFNQQANRNIRFQTLSAAERYLQLMEKQPELLQKVALKHIASYLGMDIATLSRIRKKHIR